MDANNPAFQEFRAYWKLSEDLIENASKDDLAETVRILAMQSAHYARKFGELEIPDLDHLLTGISMDDDSVGLLRDGAEALIGVLGGVMGGEFEDADRLVH